MKVGITARLVNSRLLLICLLCCLTAIVYDLYKLSNASLAPDLPGYRLSDKKEVVVICYRPGCGCEAHTILWTAEALKRGKPTLVISHHWEPDIAYIQKEYAPKGATVLMNVDASMIERYSPSGKTTVAFVQSGRIVRRAIGNGALTAALADKGEIGK